jgi:hypothetical protein
LRRRSGRSSARGWRRGAQEVRLVVTFGDAHRNTRSPLPSLHHTPSSLHPTTIPPPSHHHINPITHPIHIQVSVSSS